MTVQFDQAVTVNTTYGTPQIDLVMGRPPHRQSGYASDYSGGSGTDRLTFRYVTGDWNQDRSDIEVAPNALDLNGGRIVNLHATHRASLAHGPATLEVAPQVDTRSDAVLVLDTRAPAPVPAAPGADLPIAQTEQSGSPEFAAMLTAAGALVAGTEIVQQLALADERPAGQRATSERLPGAPGDDADDSLATIAVFLGQEAGPRAAVTASAPTLWTPRVDGQRISFNWTGSTGGTIEGYLLEYSEDAGETWTNLLGFDDQGHDLYHPASANRGYVDNGPAPGTTRSYRVTARNSDGLGDPSDVKSATTEPMVPVPACASAFWSTEIIVGYHFGYFGFNLNGGTNEFGAINDADFSFGGTTHIVRSAYFDPASQFEQEHYGSVPDYHFSVSPAFPTDRWDDLTLHIGQVELPFATVKSHTPQASWDSYRWESAQYAGTFDYEVGDWVTVCLVDSSPGVTLTLDPASISENGGTTTVTASVARASSTPFTVTVSAEPDSPAVDGDFDLSTNEVLSFAANDTSSTGIVTITAIANDVDAPHKTVTVSGSVLEDAPATAPDDVKLTIEDDDEEPELYVEVSPAEIAEGETATITVGTTATTFVDDREITLELDGSATETADYTVAATTLTLVASERSFTTTITALDDTVVEDAETITVEASHDSTVIGSKNVTISANDATDFTVEVSAATIAEGEASEVTVSTGGVTFESVQTIALALSGDATEGAGNDYTIAPAEITIVAGSTSGTATITALDDTVVEEAETIMVEASHDSTVIGSKNVEISANDATDFTVEVSAATIAEGETSEVTVSTGGVTFETDQAITLALSGDATEGAGNDYTIAPAAITIVAGSTSGTATITAVDDTVVEGAETITVEASHDSTVIGSVDVEISANDATDFMVEVSAATIAEGETSEVTVKTGGVTFETDQTIALALSGSATEGASNDYTIAPAAITIVAGSTSGTATITALDEVATVSWTVRGVL